MQVKTLTRTAWLLPGEFHSTQGGQWRGKEETETETEEELPNPLCLSPASCLPGERSRVPWLVAMQGLSGSLCLTGQGKQANQLCFGFSLGKWPLEDPGLLRTLQSVSAHVVCRGKQLATMRADRDAVEPSPRAILGQAQHWSQWRFCLCNICRRPFGAHNPGSPGQHCN